MLLITIMLFFGIAVGIIIALGLASVIIKQRVAEVNTYWNNKIIQFNDNWQSYHKTELDKWQIRTEALVHKTYYDAIEERDKAWKERFDGAKSKSKPPSN